MEERYSPPPSQVLLHQPVDPAVNEVPGLWEANTFFRANLKARGGPCIHRNPFEADDVTSFKPFTEQGFAANSWIFGENTIRLAPTATPDVRYYAVFGESDWNHVQVSVQMDPEDRAAGFAIGIETSPTGIRKALLAMVDQADGTISVQRWSGGQLQSLEQKALPALLVHLTSWNLAYDEAAGKADDTVSCGKRRYPLGYVGFGGPEWWNF
jgi:hypothetical protein